MITPIGNTEVPVYVNERGVAKECTDLHVGGNAFAVTFYDYDGTVLKEAQAVLAGDSAIPPSDPTRSGWNFVGWDKPYTNVDRDLEIHATYEFYYDKTTAKSGAQETVTVEVPAGVYNCYLRSGGGGGASYASGLSAKASFSGAKCSFVLTLSEKTSITITLGGRTSGDVKPIGDSDYVENYYNGGKGKDSTFLSVTCTGGKGSGITPGANPGGTSTGYHGSSSNTGDPRISNFSDLGYPTKSDDGDNYMYGSVFIHHI